MTNAHTATRPSQRVLVVDDNPVTRYSTARVLQAAGFSIEEAATGSEALALAGGDVSAVILDVQLPDMDGFEVCQQLRSRLDTAHLPVIHLSASHIMDHDKVRGLQAGADAYITHPADPALLVATVHALMRARNAEEGMRRSEARFRAIYDQAQSGICLVDTAGRFAEVNPTMCRLLGREEEHIIARRVADFAPADWTERVAVYFDPRNEEVRRGDFPLRDATGAPVYLEWSLTPYVEPGLSLAIATDISERVALARQREDLLEREQAARAEAERTSRAKDEYIAVLSHELRTPLNAIGGWVHVLKRSGKEADLARGLEAIERNVKTQTRLISDILDMSRMGLGKLRLDLETVHLPELLASAVEALDASVRDKRLRVRIDADPALPPIVADASRLQQIVWNLLTNAVKFSNSGGTIHIGLRQQQDALVLRVQDEGQGIRPEFLPYLFDRFTQSDSSSNRFHGGLGLGLSIVQHLAELHGGTVVAKSEGPGRGATFEVTLPLRPGAHGTADAPVAAPGTSVAEAGTGIADDALTGLTIVAVDDDGDARDMLAVILADRGARVVTASSSEEALQRIAQAHPQVLISDIGMPGKDGYTLIREIRALEAMTGTPHLPAIALTAFARPQDKELATAAGFDAHCAKPMRPDGLVACVLQVIGRHN